jgi:hypothetical protein
MWNSCENELDEHHFVDLDVEEWFWLMHHRRTDFDGLSLISVK